AGLIEELRSDPTYLFPVFENAEWLFNTDLGSPPGAVTEYQGCLLFTGTDLAHQEMRNVFQQLREFSAQQGYPKPVIPEPAEPQNFGDSFGEPPPDTNFF
ncbi:MAG: hypothetical protein KDA66_20785, partial [Planctomycetaceae bacterium]|nr:hypothetical protein [Planctomycetaceae bacterium]